jgi:DNA modification methylase
MQLNTVYNQDFLTNSMPDKSVQLIIADPPYFEVKGDFDFIWKSFDDYLADVEKWVIECKRVLADNGTLFWWGMDRKIAYSQIILDKYFNLIGTPVWEKPSIANEWDTRRTFPERGQERLLMYDNGFEPDEWDNFNENVTFVFQRILDWFLSEWAKSGLTRKQVDKACNTKNVTQYWFSKRNYQIPTRDKYKILQNLCFNSFQKEYEELRLEYEELRRPFDNSMKLTDVLRFTREYNATHPTQKPEALTRALILTCSRPNDLVLAPFAGSGTECAMAAKEGRNFIGFEITERHAVMAQNRANKFINNPTLF